MDPATLFLDALRGLRVPALSAALVLAALWLARKLIEKRLTASIQHDYDMKLEALRQDHAKELESLRADLRKSEGQLEAVRSTALTATANTQAALHQRRMQAIDALWQATMKLKASEGGKGAMVGVLLNLIRPDRIEDPNVKELLAALAAAPSEDSKQTGSVDPTNLANSARPFVPAVVWAHYTAYSIIVAHTKLQLQAIKAGKLAHTRGIPPIGEMVKMLTPELAPLVENKDPFTVLTLLGKIEEFLAGELRAAAEGRESDPEIAKRAQEMAEKVAVLQAEQQAKLAAADLPATAK